MFGCFVVAILLGDTAAAYTLPAHKVAAIPAFAWKNGRPAGRRRLERQPDDRFRFRLL